MYNLGAYGAPGTVQLGVVNSYDPHTMTAEVSAFDGAAKHYNVGFLMQSCDVGNGSYSFSPPAVGSTCLFTEVSGEVLIIGAYLPPNLSGAQLDPGFGDDIGTDSELPTTTGARLNRAPGDLPNRSSLPGDSITTGPSGSRVGFKDLIYEIFMSPVFYAIFNKINNFFDIACNLFRFQTGAADVYADVDANGNTNINIQVRKSLSEKSGVPAINLDIGNNADLVDLRINGHPFLKVDAERNVILDFNTITFRGTTVDMEPTSRVKLPG